MTMHRFLPYRWRTKIDASRHAEAIVDVLETPPIVPRNDGLVLFSMIGTAVLLPYLVAVKSLWTQLGRGRVAILDDGTLTPQDMAILAHHCGDPEVIRITSVDTGPFPKGGCWERFLTILDRRRGEYWLQLDSDTVTLGPVDEVAHAISSNRSFTLLGGPDSPTVPLSLADFARSFHAEGPKEGHVQVEIESRFAQIAPERGWRYLRGCAGFAGFAAGGPDRHLARAFLQGMTELVGAEKTAVWGTEQVASNFLVANDTAPVVLPYGRYLNYWGEPWGHDAAFIHFVGTHRHAGGAYVDASRRVIDGLHQS